MRLLLSVVVMLSMNMVPQGIYAGDDDMDLDIPADESIAQAPTATAPSVTPAVARTVTPEASAATKAAVVQEPAQQQKQEQKPVVAPTAAKATATTTAAAPQVAPQAVPQAASQTTPGAQQPAKSAPSMGIDTVDIAEPSGNWLFKRVWWEKAESLYDAIKAKVEQLRSLNTNYENRRIELDRTVFDPFYRAIGMEQGELTAIVEYLMGEIHGLKERQGSLTKEEQEFLDILSKQQQALEQLQVDVEAITKADAAVDEALQKLRERTDICRNYEQQAWQHFRTIAKELSDKRARELYYTMETLSKNIDNEATWATGQFAQYFEQQLKQMQEQAQRIQQAIKELQEKGLDFKKQAEQMREIELKREQEQAAQDKEQAVQEAVATTKEEMSIMGYVTSAWDYVVSGVQSVWQSITGFFGGLFGSSEPLEVVELVNPVQQQKTPSHEQAVPQQPAATNTPSADIASPAPAAAPVPEPTIPLPTETPALPTEEMSTDELAQQLAERG